jgi:hypothetical protein
MNNIKNGVGPEWKKQLSTLPSKYVPKSLSKFGRRRRKRGEKNSKIKFDFQRYVQIYQCNQI